MKIEDHLRNFKESSEVIRESVEKGIQERQRTIGFSVSAGAIDLLEAFLHKEQLLNPSSIIKHEWFSSARRANERINFDFPKKEKIINLIIQIEEKRNILCYGKPQPEEIIEEMIDSFHKLIKVIKELGLEIDEGKI